MTARDRSESADLEVAERVRGFIAVLRNFASGAITAAELEQYARRMWPDTNGQGTPFPGNGLAATAFNSIWRPTDTELRASDVAGYIRWLTIGTCDFPARVCGVRITAAQLAEKLSLPTQRYIVDGLGWIESVEFASPITGRQFHAESSMMDGVPQNIYVRASEGTREPSAVLDLCNTLGIDAADCFLDDDEPTRWVIWRQDDNGHRAIVESFSALQKARRELLRLESSAHKQMYWIEEAPTATAG